MITVEDFAREVVKMLLRRRGSAAAMMESYAACELEDAADEVSQLAAQHNIDLGERA